MCLGCEIHFEGAHLIDMDLAMLIEETIEYDDNE